MGPTHPQNLEEKDKQKKIKIGLKMYILQCTLHVGRNVHFVFKKIFSKMFWSVL